LSRFRKEALKLKKGIEDLDNRRNIWHNNTKPMAQNFLQKIAAEAKKADYPFSFFCQVNDDDTNEETIQLSSSINKVNVYFTDKKTSSDGTSTGRRALIEKGCASTITRRRWNACTFNFALQIRKT